MNTGSAALLISMLLTHTVFASAYYQNKIVRDKDSDINVTIMRWGVPDKEVGLSEQKMDRIVGQISSAIYSQATLIFESTPVNNQKYRLVLNTGVHALVRGREAICTICRRGRKVAYSGGNNATGALTSGGCFFEIFIPRDTAMGKLRLVDVLARSDSSPDAGGASVNYFTNFNISPELMRSPSRIPLAQNTTLHEAVFSITKIKVENETEKGIEPLDSAPVPTANSPLSTDDNLQFESPVRTEAEDHAKKLVEQYKVDLGQLCSGYISALDALENRYKKSADLKSVVETQTEKARFSESRDVPCPDSGNPEIKKLQSTFLPKRAALKKQLDERIIKLVQWYQARLKTMQDEHTKGGRIEEALKVNAEIGRVKADPYHLVKVKKGNATGSTDLSAAESNPSEEQTPRDALQADTLSIGQNENRLRKVPPSLQLDLKLYYDFPKDTSPAIKNAVNNMDDGSVAGAAWSREGKFGGAYSFTAPDGRIRIAWKTQIQDSFTIAAWIYPTKKTSLPTPSVTGQGALDGLAYVFAPKHGNNDKSAGIGLSVGINGAVVTEHADVHLPAVLTYPHQFDSAWHHFAVVISGGQAVLYVDGQMVQQGVKSTRAHLLCPEELGIGGWRDRSVFTGMIDEVAVWARKLSPDDIKALYQQQ